MRRAFHLVLAPVFCLPLLASGDAAAGDAKGGRDKSGGGDIPRAGAVIDRRDDAAAKPLGPPGDGRATLTWQAPSQRTNGECLRELGGFLVKWGPLRTRLDREVRLTPAEADCRQTGARSECGPVLACRYTVEQLGPIKWYFAVQAFDGNERMSPESEKVFLDFD